MPPKKPKPGNTPEPVNAGGSTKTQTVRLPEDPCLMLDTIELAKKHTGVKFRTPAYLDSLIRAEITKDYAEAIKILAALNTEKE